MVEAVAAVFYYPGDAFGQVPGVGRRDELVVLDLEEVALPRHTQHGAHEVVAASVDARRANDVPAIREPHDVLLPGELGAPVGADGVRGIEGLIGPLVPTVEDVVGAHVQELAAPPPAGLGQVARPEGVYRVRVLRRLLAPVHAGVGGAVHDYLRRMLLDGTVYGPGVRHVESPAVEGHEVVAPPGKNIGQLQAQLSACAGEQDPHGGVPQDGKPESLSA